MRVQDGRKPLCWPSTANLDRTRWSPRTAQMVRASRRLRPWRREETESPCAVRRKGFRNIGAPPLANCAYRNIRLNESCGTGNRTIDMGFGGQMDYAIRLEP